MGPEKTDYIDLTEDSDIDHINNVVIDEDYEADANVNEVVEYAEEEDSSEAKTKNVMTEKKAEKPVEKKQETKQEKKIEKKQETKQEKKIEKTEKRVNVNPIQEKSSKPEKKKEELKPKKHIAHKKVEKMDKKKTIKSEKKSNMVQKTHKSKGTKLTWLWILIAIIVIAGVAFLIITLSKEKPVDNTTSEIAATVNGEPIYSKDIEDQYNNLNPALQQVYTKESILNQTIDELLLIQDAKDKGIKVTDAEIQTELTNFKTQNGLTDSDFQSLLEGQNLTQKDLEGLIERRLLIKDLLNETIFSNINITDDAIKQYYDQNQEKFSTPEQVTTQHILILVNENFTDSQAKAKIEQIADELNSTNFCELAAKYSEDLGSRDTCGTYTFGKGEMVQEFEEAAFNLSINQTEIVKTIYGYHLIKKLAYTPESIKPLSEVESEIRSTLSDEAAQVNFDALLSELRSKATIVNYMYKTDSANTASDTQTTGTQDTTTGPNLDNFAKCLTDKGVKFYGAYWCPHCENNKELFGDSFQYVTYVECAVEGQPQVQTEACNDAGISGYPTWVVNEKQYPGEQTLDSLAKLSGCTL
jgi:parvulin-like peptidyl-prolyl isomerase